MCNRLKVGIDLVCRFQPPTLGKNRSIPKPLNLALHQAAKCGLVCLKQQQQNQQNAAFPYEPLNSTGYQENLTCNSYQL